MPGTVKFLFLLLCCTVDLLATSEKNDSTFVPSREWQPVKKGQPIPSGLHVRHDFQTGLTEAKLLDKESEGNSKDDDADSQAKSLTLHPDESLRNSEDDIRTIDSDKQDTSSSIGISPEELKARLKKLKLAAIEDESTGAETHEHFKSYTNTKDDYKGLEVNVTTDSEILETFFQKFEKYRNSLAAESMTGVAAEVVLHILNYMEDMLHHIDNAQMFTDMGGMSKIISPCFNATSDEIKAEALRLLGTAVQSNPKVQAKALEHDFVQKLLRLLASNNKVAVQSRCLFALSALVRQFPAAQKALIDHGGLEIFGVILDDGHLQTQSRVMKLMSDLAVERTDHKELEDEQLRRRKTKEYASVDFEEKLLGHDYCKHLTNLMIGSFSNGPFGDSNSDNHEFLTIILESMITLRTICKRDFKSEKFAVSAAVVEALRHYDNSKGAAWLDNPTTGYFVLLLMELRSNLYDESHDEL